jgi:hypothetical protein
MFQNYFQFQPRFRQFYLYILQTFDVAAEPEFQINILTNDTIAL